jgi:hypothetical protein
LTLAGFISSALLCVQFTAVVIIIFVIMKHGHITGKKCGAI